MTKTLRGLPTLLVGMLLIAVLFTAYTAQQSLANHEPANKTGAAGSAVQELGPNGEQVVLEDTIRVSSTQDAIISVTSECSILTSLLTGEEEENVGSKVQDSSYSFGEVQMRVEIDGKAVPVTYTDSGNKDSDASGEDPVGDDGNVVFCNRAYQRTVQDSVQDNDEGCEDPGEDTDGDETTGECEGDLDVERDYIATRTANGFNWLAKDLGLNYDNAADGNNIVTIQVIATYTYDDVDNDDDTQTICPTAEGTETECSNAYVGKRTLIVEPTNVAIHEFVTQEDGEGF